MTCSKEIWPKVAIIVLNWNGWREGGPMGNLEGDLRWKSVSLKEKEDGNNLY